jgi:hypothetical protein
VKNDRLSRQRGVRTAIAPHRSYRTISVDASGAFLTLPALVVVEVIAVWLAPAAARAMARFAFYSARAEGVAVRPFGDRFGWVELQPMTFTMHHHDWVSLVVMSLVCALVVALLSFWQALPMPLRFYINLNALVVGGAALYILFTGHLGYDSAAFSQLMLRTALLTWLTMPIFIALFAALFPFSWWERLLFIGITVAYDVPISIVRYAAFVGILARTGPALMPDLYLLFGPLLDAIPIITIFSVFLVRAARRIDRNSGVWAWM